MQTREVTWGEALVVELFRTDGGLKAAVKFGARCECGAAVTVVDGRIPVHYPGVDERPA